MKTDRSCSNKEWRIRRMTEERERESRRSPERLKYIEKDYSGVKKKVR